MIFRKVDEIDETTYICVTTESQVSDVKEFISLSKDTQYFI
jgi:hypothetical protein